MEVSTTISIIGVVKNATTGKPIPQANVYLKSDRFKSVHTNEKGEFALQGKGKDEDQLVVTCPGFIKHQKVFASPRNRKLTVELSKKLGDKSFDDKALVKLAIKGDQLACSKLMKRYKDSIFFMVNKMVKNAIEAEDLTMVTFGKAFKKLETYNPDSAAFSTWLFRIAVNNSIDHIRKKKPISLSLDKQMNDSVSDDSYSDVLPAYETDPEEEMIKKQKAKLMRELIFQMDPKYRRLIELRYFEELSYQEIVQEINVPLGTVKAQLFRAKDILFNILKKSKDNFI